MSDERVLGLFEGVGIELEYMIVQSDTLAVHPIADALLREVGGHEGREIERGAAAWSNELAMHVIEIKTNGPAKSLDGLGAMFQQEIRDINARLAPRNAKLLPTAMHPFMDPFVEFRLWPHEDGPIYRAFDRIFDCRGHGWANLQSMHINLPFANDQELEALHAAIRLVLPLLPGLAASSPFVDGQPSPFLDARLDAYWHHTDRLPVLVGDVIPDTIRSRRDYDDRILRPIYEALAPHDPSGILQHEWANARGCIARFDRMALEIRLLDTQECPDADIAVASAVLAAVRALVEETWAPRTTQQGIATSMLSHLLREGITSADATMIDHPHYLACFGLDGPHTVAEVWRHIIETQCLTAPHGSAVAPYLTRILDRGCLARRIVSRTGRNPSRAQLRLVYEELAECLAQGKPFS